jgi:large conductance mechanosensitive channel
MKIKKDLIEVLGEFKKFIMKGNILDLAVALIVGASFGKIVSSLVADMLMPVIGLIMGKINFTTLFIALDFNTYENLEAAKKAGAPLLMYGNFLQSIIDFTIVGFAIFALVKGVNKAQQIASKKEEAVAAAEKTTKDCPECYSVINIKAKICPHCQSKQL